MADFSFAVALRAVARAVVPTRPAERICSIFEFWPWYVFYPPVIAQWMVLMLCHRSVALPRLANPHIEAGGLFGESKVELLSQLGPEARRWLAPFTSVAVSAEHNVPGQDLAGALAAMSAAGLEFPLVAKPDRSCRGAGVRVIRSAQDLSEYLCIFPRGERLILQQLAQGEHEAGVFYARRPGETAGRIVSLTLKYFPVVVGDGRSTLEELIRGEPRAQRIAHVYLERHAQHRQRILASGEVFRLVFAGNHCKGAIFRDGNAHVTPAMEARFCAIARSIPEFYFGRFDVRFASLIDLKRGENFGLVEVNGAGSEATHIWDREARLLDAYRALFRQSRLLFEIAHTNRQRGFRPTSLRKLFQLARRQLRLMSQYPLTD